MRLRIVCLGVIAAVLAGSGGVAAPAASAQQPPFLDAGRLFAPDGHPQENFGSAVALDGNTLAVGARNATVGVHGGEGAVYVYVRTGSGWTLQQQLTASGGDVNDHLGHSVALRGDVIVAGAPYDTVGSNSNQGAVYVFRRAGSTWTQEARITGPGGATGDRFGWALGLSGTTVAVGAPYEGELDFPNSGVVHVFSTDEDRAWTETARLTASDAARADHFGYSVALAGDRLLAGAPHRDGRHNDEGRVYAYARSDSAWIEWQRLDAPSPDHNDRFGAAVALDGTDAIVGAPGHDGAERDQGAAFAFAYAAGLWVHAQTLTLPAGDETDDARFGAAAAVDGGVLAVGAPGNPETTRVRRDGVVHTFEGGQGAWTPHQVLRVPDAAVGAQVGAAVAVSGGALVAGAPHDDFATLGGGHNNKQGSVTVFELFAAADDAYTTDESRTLSVAAPGVLANDANPSRGELIAERVSAPAHGTLTLHSDGSFSYHPRAGFSGADSFTYHARAGDATSNVATAAITVRPLPVAMPDSYATDQNTALLVNAATGVLANDTSGTGDPLTAVLVSGPAHGTLTSALAPDGSFTYTPAPGFFGQDTFTYRASDGANTSAPATVTIAVHEVLPPAAVDDSYATDEDTPLTVPVATGVLANDTGTSPLTAGSASDPPNGAVTLSADGSFTYTPDAGFFGTDTFTYQAANGAGTDTATVTITVNQVLPPVEAVDDSYATDQDTSLTATVATGVLANDTGTSALTAGSASDPPNGAVTLSADGSFTYTPDAGFFGTDTFTYQAANGAGTDTATVTITVNQVSPPATAPAAVDDSYATDEDTPLTVPVATGVLANDTGPSALTAGSASDPPDGAVTLSADGSFTYTPDAGFFGTDTFTYQAANGAGTDTATVTITVDQVLRPTAVDDGYGTQFGTALTVPVATGVLANDTGTSPLTAGAASDPPNGAVALNADGSFTYTPNAGFAGSDSFTYEAANAAGTDAATVTIAVQPPPNQPPVAGDDAFTTRQDTPLTITAAAVAANDSDADGDPLTAATPLPLTNPPHGTITVAGGAGIYTPDAGFRGIDRFTYAISDGADNSAAARIRIAVTPVTPPDPGGGGEVITDPGGGVTVPLPDVHPAIAACRIRVDITRVSDRVVHRTVVATGRVRIGDRENVKVKLKPRRDALRRTSNRVGPIPITVRVVCRTDDGAVLGRAERRFAARAVSTPGSWVPDHATLTATGERFVRTLARRLRALNVTRIRCDGHTADVPAHHVNKRALSRRRAELVCRELRQRSLRARPSIVPHAGRDPIATNATEAGRAANRRVAVTVLLARKPRSSRAVSSLLRLAVSHRVAPRRQRAMRGPGA